MLKLQFIVAFLAVINIAVRSHDDWESFKATHKRVYSSPDEEMKRLAIWRQNNAKIHEHNRRFNKGETTFTMKMNQFGDLTMEEFGKLHKATGKIMGLEPTKKIVTDGLLPSAVDWTQHGLVGKVEDQSNPQDCGSCWAFSAVGNLEGQMAKLTKTFTSLSKQQLVDCDMESLGCDGGLIETAFKYVKKNGITLDSVYPYEARDGVCRYNPTRKVLSTISGFQTIDTKSEVDIQAVLAEYGPISAHVQAGLDTFQFYHSGVYKDFRCNSSYNHGILLVGYGFDKSANKPYWLVKNSWGTQWGESGYMKLLRNFPNLCGIAELPIFSIL